MTRGAGIARWTLLGVTVAIALIYAGDLAYARYRLARRSDNGPLAELRFYYGAVLKNGKTEVFYDSPQTQTCVRSIFPQLGYPPCWYASRTNVKVVGP